MEGLSDALAKEVAHLGIKVTVVEPGPFRTDWAGRSLRQAKVPIADYAPSSGARRRNISDNSGKQAGDPVRAAAAIVQAVLAPRPPLHLLLGRFAFETAKEKFRTFGEEVEEWRELTVGADYPAES